MRCGFSHGEASEPRKRSSVVKNSQYLTFLRQWIANPLMVGAIMPSGPALAGLMANAAGYTSGNVLELGPGTGVFTEALLARGFVQEQLTLVELDGCFADLLSERFPGARIVRGSAARLSAAGIGKDARYDTVIIGLPLLSMPAWTVYRIVRSAALRLSPCGQLLQFTCGVRCPVPDSILLRAGLKAQLLGTVIRNMPPASVYRISHSGSQMPVERASPARQAENRKQPGHDESGRGTGSSVTTTSRSLICSQDARCSPVRPH